MASSPRMQIPEEGEIPKVVDVRIQKTPWRPNGEEIASRGLSRKMLDLQANCGSLRLPLPSQIKHKPDSSMSFQERLEVKNLIEKEARRTTDLGPFEIFLARCGKFGCLEGSVEGHHEDIHATPMEDEEAYVARTFHWRPEDFPLEVATYMQCEEPWDGKGFKTGKGDSKRIQPACADEVDNDMQDEEATFGLDEPSPEKCEVSPLLELDAPAADEDGAPSVHRNTVHSLHFDVAHAPAPAAHAGGGQAQEEGARTDEGSGNPALLEALGVTANSWDMRTDIVGDPFVSEVVEASGSPAPAFVEADRPADAANWADWSMAPVTASVGGQESGATRTCSTTSSSSAGSQSAGGEKSTSPIPEAVLLGEMVTQSLHSPLVSAGAEQAQVGPVPDQPVKPIREALLDGGCRHVSTSSTIADSLDGEDGQPQDNLLAQLRRQDEEIARLREALSNATSGLLSA